MGFSREGSARSFSLPVLSISITRKAVQGFPAMQVIPFFYLVLNSQDQAGQVLLGEKEREGKKDWRQRQEPGKQVLMLREEERWLFKKELRSWSSSSCPTHLSPYSTDAKAILALQGSGRAKANTSAANFSFSPLSSKTS